MPNKLSNKKKYEHKVILILGLIFFVLGTLFNIYYISQFKNDIYSFQSPVLTNLSDLTPLKIISFTIIVFPFLEEIVFRLWTMKKRFTYIISLIGISLIIFQISKVFDFCSGCIDFISLFLLDKNTIINAVITSLIFAFMHYGNIDSSLCIVNLIPYFGLSLILSFIGLKFNFSCVF